MIAAARDRAGPSSAVSRQNHPMGSSETLLTVSRAAPARLVASCPPGDAAGMAAR
jgi:hypothetical protein